MRKLFSEEAELSVLGAVMLDETVFDDVVATGLAAELFFLPKHRAVFAAMGRLVSERVPIDVLTVAEALEAAGELHSVGGAVQLSRMVDLCPSVDNATAYARIVVDFATERRFLAAMNEVNQILLHGEYADHASRMAHVHQVLMSTDRDEKHSSQVTMHEGVLAMCDRVRELADAPADHVRGLPFGLKHIDYRLGGAQPGDLIIIAGRPSMGKTAYALNIARHALNAGKHGVVFSLEMSARSLVERMTAAQGLVDLGLIKSAKVVGLPEQLSKFSLACHHWKSVKGEIVFDDTGSLSINELVARAKRIHRKRPLDYVMVDHVGLVDSTLRTEQESQKIGQITRELKKLAKALNCPVIALSQVNRECEKRANKRPMMSDLKSSGSIEQDADVIQFVYRDEYYNENTQTPGQIEVISAKVRDGETGTDFLDWVGRYVRVESRDSAVQPLRSKHEEDIA